ncbi:MAG: hypothetical protein NTW53_18440, partial [Burkholderiales bacterium]|nr:hypothetical protein [Burkholderiales bacterium]
LFETLNRYEIDNTVSGAAHRRGVYCFVNKHVLVTETPYDARWFLRARLSTPGRGLLEERRARLAIASSQIEAPPRFDIGPDDVHPTTYMALAKRFRAQGLTPPPQATMHLARTYKCDSSNASEERAEGLEKIAKSAMPLLKPYRRYLITDTIEVPDGYMVQEVRLTVDHGANGLSIPVDLPFKLGATFVAIPMMAPMMALSPILVPVALWQVLQLASPLFHHNTDSSAVTSTIGNETQQSNYFFFEPEFLIREIFQLFGSFSALGEGVVAQIREWVDQLDDRLGEQAVELAGAMQDVAQGVADAVRGVFDTIGNALSAFSLANPDVPGVINAILSAFANFGGLLTSNAARIPTTLFDPFTEFLQDVLGLVSEAAESAFSDLLAALVAQSDNSQLLAYGDSYGTTGALPVACNIVAIKPSVTITLNACIARTDRALDDWRLQTYERLYQAYLQQAAEYEARAFSHRLEAQSPGTLRQLEQRAIRVHVIAALDALHPPAGGAAAGIGPERIELFEHGIDWDNITYRSFNYGPDMRELRDEREGLYHGVDAAHRGFLGAAWAEVLLPLSGNAVLERAMLAFIESGNAQIGADLTNHELAQLWQDLITRRRIFADTPEPINYPPVVLPTDLLVVRQDDSLPAVPPAP